MDDVTPGQSPQEGAQDAAPRASAGQGEIAEAGNPGGSLRRAKFSDPCITATGEPRAEVALSHPETIWFNTGTLCNIACRNCYIESSPHNDSLVYLTEAEVRGFLDEIAQIGWPVREIGFTGGEPFMNPQIIAMLSAALEAGFEVLVLTNAMRPMMRPRVQAGLVELGRRHGERLTLRVSLDHYRPGFHDAERGEGSFACTVEGLRWLHGQGLRLAVAGRMMWNEDEASLRAGFATLFAENGLALDAASPRDLVLFPEMDATADVPEITTACWDILGKRPDEVMCASSRMIVRRRGAARASVVACTLLPYDPQFELGHSLAEAARPVRLNHPHCARFCVLGGASCSV